MLVSPKGPGAGLRCVMHDEGFGDPVSGDEGRLSARKAGISSAVLVWHSSHGSALSRKARCRRRLVDYVEGSANAAV